MWKEKKDERTPFKIQRSQQRWTLNTSFYTQRFVLRRLKSAGMYTVFETCLKQLTQDVFLVMIKTYYNFVDFWKKVTRVSFYTFYFDTSGLLNVWHSDRVSEWQTVFWLVFYPKQCFYFNTLRKTAKKFPLRSLCRYSNIFDLLIIKIKIETAWRVFLYTLFTIGFYKV